MTSLAIISIISYQTIFWVSLHRPSYCNFIQSNEAALSLENNKLTSTGTLKALFKVSIELFFRIRYMHNFFLIQVVIFLRATKLLRCLGIYVFFHIHSKTSH